MWEMFNFFSSFIPFILLDSKMFLRTGFILRFISYFILSFFISYEIFVFTDALFCDALYLLEGEPEKE